MKKSLQLLLLLSFTIFLHNCQNDDLPTPTIPDTEVDSNDEIFKTEHFGNATTGNFIGIIKDVNGNKLENVQITIGTAISMTDRNGMFIMNNVDVFENFAYIKAQKDGYINGSRVVIPKTTGANRVTIELLKKETTASITSGQPSQVSHNGTQVNFSGDFIRTDGSIYNGTVNVVIHYVAPNRANTTVQMPGSLLAQTASNDAQNLETYGMISVNLFSSSGETLNINPENPATIEFPIDYTQTSIAPDTIRLWYFDEENGYWKEDGQATKNGNKYVAEVTHFTWWNCDIPLDFINFCFSLEPTNNAGATPYYVVLSRESNGQIMFTGVVNSREMECGLIPRNEEIRIRIYGFGNSCNAQIIHEQVVGPYSSDASTNITFIETIATTTISGMANNCSGNPITNGYGFVDDQNTFSITDGTFNIGIQHCSSVNVSLQIFDYDTNQWTIIDSIDLEGNSQNLGIVSTCQDSGGTYNNNVTLLTQQDVNQFGALGYTGINGNLTIGDFSSDSTITNLNPLTTLETISGNLRISNNQTLSSLSGLNNLTSVDHLYISYNSLLTSINALSNLTNSGTVIISYNNALNSLDGLQGITTVSSIYINNNNALTSLEGLNSITSVARLNINNNQGINSLIALSNLTDVNIIDMSNIPQVTSLQGLNQITSLSFLRVSYSGISDFSELSNLTSVDLVSIGGNSSLVSLNGLENLLNNTGLIIGRDLDFDIINDAPNENLTDFCALQNLFINGNYTEVSTSPFNGVTIVGNAYNPTVQNIIDGNCSQ